MHALSLDFNHAQLEQILVGAEPALTAFVRAELSKDPASPRTIELDGYVSFAVRARLGCLQTGTYEQFIPLVAKEILYVPSNPSDSLKPIREWEEARSDNLLRTLDRHKGEPPVSQERSSTPQNPISVVMIDPPSPYDTLAKWEQHLTEVQSLPESVQNRPELIAAAQRWVDEKRREQGRNRSD
jgi:hypothetical protein